jgi:Beta-lactamase superfamily domain
VGRNRARAADCGVFRGPHFRLRRVRRETRRRAIGASTAIAAVARGQFKDPQAIWIDTRRAMLHFIFGKSEPTAKPDAPVPVVHTSAAALASAPQSGLRVTWFGHSSTLIEVDGSKILIDPFWSERASPFAWAGPKRWYPPPIAQSDLPPIDVVLISHDHYDHLDYASIVAMRSWHNVFVVPLGVGAHLSRWGIPNERIIELD